MQGNYPILSAYVLATYPDKVAVQNDAVVAAMNHVSPNFST